MIVALPFCHKDEHLALLNLELALKLDGGPVPFDCVLCIDSKTEPSTVQHQAVKYFRTVKLCRYAVWTGSPNWPSPHNHAWQSTARYMDASATEPWLWWEADAVPLVKGWLSTLQTAYQQGGKPFAGHWIDNNNGFSYMNGAGIYPSQVNRFDTACYLCHQASFDLVLGPRLVKNCHRINHLIAHSLSPVSFSSVPDIWEKSGKEAVLFHNCKDGTIMELLTKTTPQKMAEKVTKAVEKVKDLFVVDSPVTVVITNFKRPDRVRMAFKSCLEAGVKRIVISSSGTDTALEEVHRGFQKVKSDVVISAIKDDRGCNEMWLRGVQLAQTPWVHILHDDDLLLPDFRRIEEHLKPEFGFIYWPSERRFYETNKPCGLVTHFPSCAEGAYPTSIVLDFMLKPDLYSISPVQGLFQRVDLICTLEECERIAKEFEARPNMMVGNDALIWMRACEKHPLCYVMSKPMTAFGSWAGSTTIADSRNGQNHLKPLYNRMREYFQKNPRQSNGKLIELGHTTLMGLVWSEDMDMLDRTVRVLNYCADFFRFQRIVLFTHLAPARHTCAEIRGIHGIKDIMAFNLAVNKEIPPEIHSDFLMSIHEDGFPIRFDLWEPKFLEYDMIGAPWFDGVVGNTAFSFLSQKMLREIPGLVYYGVASDTIICRNLRPQLEKKGITYAPTDVAYRFSTEWQGHHNESFGFHGRTFSGNPAEKYVRGWKQIQEWEGAKG